MITNISLVTVYCLDQDKARDFYVDILSRLGTAFRYDDLDFAEVEVEGVPVRLATPETLIELKRDTVRPIDKDDAARLRDHLGLRED